MSHFLRTIRHLYQCAFMLATLLIDAARLLRLHLHSPAALAAENLFLRKQLALYQEHHVKPRRASHATRITLLWLSQWFDWHQALVVVQPATFTRWRRQGFRLFRPWTSCCGRPPIPTELQGLIRQMAHENLTWGQRRIAHELRLKLGLRVSPRTVRKYMPTHLDRAPGHRVPAQSWRTFVHNHAWDLIINSVAADLTRGVQAVPARMIRVLQCWSGRSGVSACQETAPRDAVSLALLIDTMVMPAAWWPDTMESLRVDERSPPAMAPPHTDDPFTAARVTPVDMFDVRPVVAACCWWHRAGPRVPNTAPLSEDGIRGVPWRRVA